MSETLNHYYCQTLTLKREDQTFECEFCVASIPLELLKASIKSFLHPDELKEFQQFAFEKRQFDYLMGQYTSKQAIAHFVPGISLPEIGIDHGIFQFPVVTYPGSLKIQTSHSHSKQMCVALAFDEHHPMAIDIEAVDTTKSSTITTQLTEHEKILLSSIDQISDAFRYTLFWTIKEALSKELRTGLTTPFEIFAVKSIEFERDCWISQFENFYQYKVISFLLGDFVCSILCPKRSELTIDISAIQTWANRVIK